MPVYLFTSQGYDELKEAIVEARKKFDQMMHEKGEAGRGQDGYHDETYRAAEVQERIWSKKLGELQKLASSARIIEPEEQNEKVQFGVGVVIEYDDGTERNIILGGYQISHFKGLVSVHSPLGKSLIGAKINEKRSFKVGEIRRVVKIKRIFPPSEARRML